MISKKLILARDTLLAYGDRDLQSGAFIIHDGITIAFYSIKPTYSRKKYKVTEKELMTIIETLKEFITILIVKILRIYSNS